MDEETTATQSTANCSHDCGGDDGRQRLIDLGSAITRSSRGNIYTLTIVGQVEGHQVLPDNTKSTKYEHVMPLLASLEQNEEIGRAHV